MAPDHEKAGKGITLTEEEARQLSSMLICVLITACDSENVKKAKEAYEAYEAEDYVAVVADLETEQDLSNDVEEMLNTSKAHVAYDEGDYTCSRKAVLLQP